MGLTLDAEAALGNKRIKRFSAVVEDGKIKVGAGFCPSFESAIRSTVAS
jgi:peroxiredoxin